MERKAVSGIMLTLLLIGMLSLAFNIQSVEIPDEIYIRADGSIAPPTANITSVDNVTYTLTGNINGSIVVERSNIVVDGAGYTLQGFGSRAGFRLNDINNVTIKNVNIKDFDLGIYVLTSSNNNISGNNITNNEYGIRILGSSKNCLRGNQIANNENGVYLTSSSNNVFRNNNLVNNSYNFHVSAYHLLSHYIHDLDLSNTVNGKPIYYLTEQNNLTITPSTYPDIGYLALISSTNITIERLELKNNGQGILLANTKNSRIRNNNVINNKYGIELSASSDNSISGNNIANNSVYGIILDESSNNTIFGNDIADNLHGINLFASEALCSNNSVSGNDITDNGCGLMLTGSSSNIIFENNITNSDYGVRLWGSSSNIISGNNITNNGCAIDLWGGSSDKIYHNNFVDNSRQARTDYPSNNVWDDSYPSGGNYWSDYTGVDIRSGANQDELGSDGIGDTPYAIDTENQDNYPLMNPYGEFPRDTAPPTIFILSPENKTYPVDEVSLTFSSSEPFSWVGYSLDGQINVTIAGNTTLSELSDGSHTIIVYAEDTTGNIGASEIIWFSINTKPWFLQIWILAAIPITIATGVVLVIYFSKFKKPQALNSLASRGAHFSHNILDFLTFHARAEDTERI